MEILSLPSSISQANRAILIQNVLIEEFGMTLSGSYADSVKFHPDFERGIKVYVSSSSVLVMQLYSGGSSYGSMTSSLNAMYVTSNSSTNLVWEKSASGKSGIIGAYSTGGIYNVRMAFGPVTDIITGETGYAGLMPNTTTANIHVGTITGGVGLTTGGFTLSGGICPQQSGTGFIKMPAACNGKALVYDELYLSVYSPFNNNYNIPYEIQVGTDKYTRMTGDSTGATSGIHNIWVKTT